MKNRKKLFLIITLGLATITDTTTKGRKKEEEIKKLWIDLINKIYKEK